MKKNVNSTLSRGRYNEIIMSSLATRTRKQVEKLLKDATKAKKVDEHGSWEFGCEFDKKGRGSSLNSDLYAYGYDYHSGKFLCIIQIRECVIHKKTWFKNIRKSYFLLGRNEDKTTFAHPVESLVIHHAIKKNLDIIYRVQSWMYDVEYSKVKRQGDLSIIPTRKPIGTLLTEKEIIIEESHILNADEIYKHTDKIYYAKNPELIHLPNTHSTISGIGWHKVKVSKRARYWNFAAPTID